MGAQLVWVVPDDQGHLEARPMTDERLRYMLARLATWQRLNRHGNLVPAAPPTGIVKSLLATPDPALPVLGGIVSTPVFGANGALITAPGYHQETRLLYHPAPGFVLPPIAERPAVNDVEAARELLLADLLGDFPFVGDAERAHAMSLLLLGFVRAMIEGPTPLHVIEKPERGTGAGLMIDAIATILTGSPVVVMTAATDEEEWRKRITAKLRQMPLLSVVDNINQEVDSAALAAALTAPFWEDRILGLSETTRLPIRCIWIATGNNPRFSREITRRIVRIRMDAGMENPHLRTDFRHPDLMGWVKANRARLVAACLTLIQSWVAAGRPMSTKRIGSFEAWARVIGGILANAGIAGFLGNIEDLMARSDGESTTWRGFVSQWWNRYGTAEVGTSDLYEAANTCEPPLPLGTGGDRSQRIRLGRMLGRLRDRVFEIEGRNVRVMTARVSHQAQRWLLQLQDQPNVTTSGSGNVGNVHSGTSLNIPLNNSNEISAPGNVGNVGNVFPRLRTCADARTPACEKEGGEKYSPSSPHSPNDEISMGSGGECAGEYSEWHSPSPHPSGPVPDWLKEVL